VARSSRTRPTRAPSPAPSSTAATW
jgi:hypothetical protein